MVHLPLLLGVKRRRFRDNDARTARADAEFAAKRPGILVKHRFTCKGCDYESKESAHLDVHHLDDNHHNNDDLNLCPACHTCHPYQHVGELVRRSDVAGEGLGKATLIAAIPEIEPSDLNLLQRAIGMALLDEKEAPIARQMIEFLAERSVWVKAEFGTFKPADFAGAFAALTDEQYANRRDAISDLRLLFNEETLRKLGREMARDFPAMPVASWPDVSRGVERKAAATGAR
jgi:hypothetical protein